MRDESLLTAPGSPWMIQTLLRGENDSKQSDEIRAKDYTECQISRSTYQSIGSPSWVWDTFGIILHMLKMPVIIFIDTSSNQVLGSAGENVRLP